MGVDVVGLPLHDRPEYVFVAKLVDVVLRGGAEEDEVSKVTRARAVRVRSY